jgi:hypothetical protein
MGQNPKQPVLPVNDQPGPVNVESIVQDIQDDYVEVLSRSLEVRPEHVDQFLGCCYVL